MTSTILFLCTGNYYRSRFAEVLFNHHAPRCGLRWRAESAGLAPDCFHRNPGPISPHALAGLEARGIPPALPWRSPRDVSRALVEQATRIVAVKEAEHRTLVESRFPDLLPRVEFWHVHDLDCAPPERALAELEERVHALIAELAE